MRTELDDIAPRFVAMAHGIGVAVAATSGEDGRPHTRPVQPVWAWDGTRLTGVVSTHIDAPKVFDLRRVPSLSLTYWNPAQDTCTADCDVTFVTDVAGKAAAWDLFTSAPEPAGFDPAIDPEWESPASPSFGVVRLDPVHLRVMPGTLMLTGEGEVRTWRRDRREP